MLTIPTIMSAIFSQQSLPFSCCRVLCFVKTAYCDQGGLLHWQAQQAWPALGRCGGESHDVFLLKPLTT